MDEDYTIEVEEDGEPVFLSVLASATAASLLILLAGITMACVRFVKRVRRG